MYVNQNGVLRPSDTLNQSLPNFRPSLQDIHKSVVKASDTSQMKLASPGDNVFYGWEEVQEVVFESSKQMMPKGKNFQATEIPFTRSLYGNFLLNPSALSLNSSQEMVYDDSVIYSSVKYLSIMITSRIGRYRHQNSDVGYLINHSLNNLKLGKRRFFDALMTAIWAGFSANYLVWGVYKGKYIIVDVHPMPPTSIMMSADNAGRLQEYGGVMQYYYNTNLNGWANAFTYGTNGAANPNIPSGDYPLPLRVPYINPVWLHPFHSKDILLHRINGNDGATNPYGRMMTRSVWKNYINKMGLMQNMMIGATYKAAPLVIFYTDSTRPVQDINGQVISIADDVKAQLESLNGNGFIVINGKEKDVVSHAVIDNTAKLDDFVLLMKEQDSQIRQGFLTPDSTMQSEGNFATSLSHGSMYAAITDSMTHDLLETLLTQFIKPMINYNFKDEEDLGHFELIEPSLDDKLKLSKIAEFGLKNNILCQDVNDKEQMLKDTNMVRKSLGWDTVEDIFVNPEQENLNMNMGQVNRDTNTPYADSIDNYKKRYET